MNPKAALTAWILTHIKFWPWPDECGYTPDGKQSAACRKPVAFMLVPGRFGVCAEHANAFPGVAERVARSQSSK